MSPMPRSSARTTSTFGRDILRAASPPRCRRRFRGRNRGILPRWKNLEKTRDQRASANWTWLFSPNWPPITDSLVRRGLRVPSVSSIRSEHFSRLFGRARTDEGMDGWMASPEAPKRPNGVEPESYRELVHDSHRTPVCRVEKAPMLPHAYAHQGFPPQSSLAARARGRGWVDRSRSRVSSDFPTPHTRAHRVRDNERFVAQPT